MHRFEELVHSVTVLIVQLLYPVAPTPWGTGDTCPPLLQMAGHRGTMSRRTANEKLTKLYWASQKRSPKRLIELLEPKKWKGTAKKFSRRFVPDQPPPLPLRTGDPPPTFEFVPAALAVSTGDRIQCFQCSRRSGIVWQNICVIRPFNLVLGVSLRHPCLHTIA